MLCNVRSPNSSQEVSLFLFYFIVIMTINKYKILSQSIENFYNACLVEGRKSVQKNKTNKISIHKNFER